MGTEYASTTTYRNVPNTETQSQETTYLNFPVTE